MTKRTLILFLAGITYGALLRGAEETPESSGPDSGTVQLEETVLQSRRDPAVERIADESNAATRFEVPLAETPRSIEVIGEQQMEDRGVQTVQDALLYSPGVYGATYGFDTRGDWAKVRGVSPQEYRDGLKRVFGFYNNTRPHPYTLERVEVVKGPASTLYGQGSVGGILNVVTKRPRAEPFREIEVEYGSHDWRQMGVDLTGPIDEEEKFLYRIVGAIREANTQVDHVEDDAIALTPSFTWRPKDGTELTLVGNYQDTDSGLSTQFLPLEGTLLPGREIPPSTYIGEPSWDKYDTEQGAITALFDHELNETWSFSAKARYTDSEADYRTHWVTYNPRPTVMPDGRVQRTIYHSDHTSEIFTADTRFIGDFSTGDVDHRMAIGADYQQGITDNDFALGYAAGGTIDIFDPTYGENLNTPFPPNDNPETRDEQVGVYLNNHIVIQDNWILTWGARRDYADQETEGAGQNREDYHTTVDAGLMYAFDNGISPYASYAESFEPIVGTSADGRSFDPKEGRQFEAGVKYGPAGMNSLFTVAAFEITERNRPTGPFGNQTQVGEARIRGIELGSQSSWRDFYLQTGYSYLDTEVTKSDSGNEGNNLPSVPDHQFSAWTTYAPSGGPLDGWRAGVGVRYAGNTWDGSDRYETPSYTLVDAMVGYDFGNFDIALNATNIEDEEYVTSSENATAFYGNTRRVVLSARYRF